MKFVVSYLAVFIIGMVGAKPQGGLGGPVIFDGPGRFNENGGPGELRRPVNFGRPGFDGPVEKSEERSTSAQQKLLEVTQDADENNGMCKVLENRFQQDEERIDQLTNQLKEARMLAEDADTKSDEVSRKLAFVEDELEVGYKTLLM